MAAFWGIFCKGIRLRVIQATHGAMHLLDEIKLRSIEPVTIMQSRESSIIAQSCPDASAPNHVMRFAAEIDRV
jgi:hypothetical protein